MGPVSIYYQHIQNIQHHRHRRRLQRWCIHLRTILFNIRYVLVYAFKLNVSTCNILGDIDFILTINARGKRSRICPNSSFRGISARIYFFMTVNGSNLSIITEACLHSKSNQSSMHHYVTYMYPQMLQVCVYSLCQLPSPSNGTFLSISNDKKIVIHA